MGFCYVYSTMSRKKRRYNIMVKKTEQPNYMIQACCKPDVMAGWTCCDGDCSRCEYSYEYDVRDGDPYEEERKNRKNGWPFFIEE